MEQRYIRKENENELDYAMRLIDLKKNRDENLDWQDIVDLLGLDLNRDSLRKSQDTEFGGYAVYNKMKERMLKEFNTDENYDLDFKLQELKKERMKLNEERASLNRKLRLEARMEQLCETIIKSAEIISKEKPIELTKTPEYEDNDNYAVLLLSDIHYGLDISTINNSYNEEIFQERFNKLLDKTTKFVLSEDIHNIYVLGLGDLINGIIHISTRLENKETIINQVLKFSEYLVQFLLKLALFANVHYYQVSGNHGRIFNKDESFNDDNFEILIKYYVETRIGEHIKVYNNELSNEIGHLNIAGKDYLFAHGHRDNIKTVAEKLATITNIKPEAIFLGHTHSPQMLYDNKVEIYVNGSLCGDNEYAENLRVTGEPSQTLFLLDENGIKYHYIVKV